MKTQETVKPLAVEAYLRKQAERWCEQVALASSPTFVLTSRKEVARLEEQVAVYREELARHEAGDEAYWTRRGGAFVGESAWGARQLAQRELLLRQEEADRAAVEAHREKLGALSPQAEAFLKPAADHLTEVRLPVVVPYASWEAFREEVLEETRKNLKASEEDLTLAQERHGLYQGLLKKLLAEVGLAPEGSEA